MDKDKEILSANIARDILAAQQDHVHMKHINKESGKILGEMYLAIYAEVKKAFDPETE